KSHPIISQTSLIIFSFFFFSSRRRHTRSKRDWSSDVCSSDLVLCGISFNKVIASSFVAHVSKISRPIILHKKPSLEPTRLIKLRSEERRVGKECKYRR